MMTITSSISDSLDGRVAVVTGAAGGIGFGCAAALHSRGARVVLADIDADRATASAERLGDGAISRQHDVTDQVSSERLVEAAREAFGRIDILVNNAGVGPRPAPVQDLDPAEFDRVLSINMRGVYLTTRAVAPLLFEAKDKGRVINISSVMGQSADLDVCHYVASKHAVIGLTRAWALEFARYGVTSNAICPGSVTTDMHVRVISAYAKALSVTEQQSRDNFIRHIPLGQFQTADDIGAAVAFLASEGARNITGTQLGVDGGWVLH